MSALLFLVIVIVAVWAILGSKRRRRPVTPTVKIEVASSISTAELTPDCGTLTAAGDGLWTLNPKAALPLTISGVDEATARRIKDLLDGWNANERRDSLTQIIGLVARSNLVCDEITAYRRKYRPIYLAKIEELKGSHPEWSSASALDREDILVELRAKAREALDLVPSDNLEDQIASDILEPEKLESTEDDALIDRFGFEALAAYLPHADRLDKVQCVPADDYRREVFEKLVSVGLARRGAEIPRETMLSCLTLKEMNEWVRDSGMKKFTRKAKATEYLVAQPWIEEEMSKRIAFRELFQLVPLPPDFRGVDLANVAAAWRYAEAVARLVANTYRKGVYNLRDRAMWRSDRSGIVGWELSIAVDAPAFCKKVAERCRRTKAFPALPAHLGCTCFANPVYESPASTVGEV